MGKHGPCYHCGVTSTPLWRNGPPEKPILCNACGSRWRTKGTLENYTPLHARGEADAIDHMARPFAAKNKEAKVLKRKYETNDADFGGVLLDHNNQGFRRIFDEDTSNRSSSGSAISNSESCAHHGGADASELTGSPQAVVWDSTVPSRKRSCVSRSKPSPVEKLTKDLYTLWHEQQYSCMSVSSESDLLLESDKPMVSVEIGHGSVLIRRPNSIGREEESEASSLSVENKRYSLSSTSLVDDKCGNLSIEKIVMPSHTGAKEERNIRETDRPEKLQILAHHNSPLGHIGLQESKGKSVVDDESKAVRSNALVTDCSLSATRPQDGVRHNFAGAKATTKGVERMMMMSSCDEEAEVDKSDSLFAPKILFSSVFGEEEDLLLDVPTNGLFPQAEFLPEF